MSIEILEDVDLEEIYPKLNSDKLKQILKYYESLDLSILDTTKNINDLPESIKFLLNRIFISKNDKSLSALKARFVNSMELIKELDGVTIEAEDIEFEKQKIDLIVRSQTENYLYWIIFLDYFDEVSVKRFDRAINKYFEGIKNEQSEKSNVAKTVPDLLIFVSLKIERKSALKYESIKIASSAIPVTHFIEYNDSNKPFEDHDLIHINQFKVKGFNFGSLDDILLCANKIVKKGKCEIKVEKSDKKVITLWKGIVNPASFFKRGGN
jgi:hypothetical protein